MSHGQDPSDQPIRHIGLIAKGRQEWIGGVEYTRNLINSVNLLPLHLRKRFKLSLLVAKACDVELFSDFSGAVDLIIPEETHAPPPLNLGQKVLSRVRRKISANAVTANPGFEHICRKFSIDFVYPYFERPLAHTRFEWASWIPDFQHKHLPEFFSSTELRERDERDRKFLTYSKKVVLSSYSALSDLQRFYPELPHEKVQVLNFHTYLPDSWCEGDPSEVQAKYHLPDRFFLVSNQFWQHKNHSVVVEAIRILKRRGIDVVVVCTGSLLDYRKPQFMDAFFARLHLEGIQTQLRVLGLVPRKDQIQLMRRSLAVIQPSKFEGWSTVVEDARGFGKTLLISDLPVHREQNVIGARYFNVDAADRLADYMAEIWPQQPGPYLDKERAGRLEARILAENSGRAFLAICGAKGIS